jgi:hypothetical protein
VPVSVVEYTDPTVAGQGFELVAQDAGASRQPVTMTLPFSARWKKPTFEGLAAASWGSLQA